MIGFIFLKLIHRCGFLWHSIRCIFDTFIICARSVVLFLCVFFRDCTCCKCSTKFFMPEEPVKFNCFQFIISKKMTWPISVFNVELVSQSSEWILLAVLCPRLYPFILDTMQLEPIGTSNRSNDHWPYKYDTRFFPPWFDIFFWMSLSW